MALNGFLRGDAESWASFSSGPSSGWTPRLRKKFMDDESTDRNYPHQNPTSEGVWFWAREALVGIGAGGISTRCRPVFFSRNVIC